MYPEIIDIQNFIAINRITIWLGKMQPIDETLILLELKINDNTYTVHAVDEYENLNYHNPVLNFIVVFRALAIINDSEDFLAWCK